MQFQNPNVDRFDLPDELKDTTPCWLRVRVPETLPSMWRSLGFAVSSLVTMTLNSSPPKGLILRICQVSGRLIIDIAVSVAHFATDEIRALRQVKNNTS